ncbi:hypothetical protein AB0L47_36990 [Streptomyces bobili]|uniref:hypothetical protein n=1 Tax=Streptomyces bobili TaxID=67280 RepID=UPI003425B090
MSDIAVRAEDDLATEYVARVERDLADNAEEQERVTGEIESLGRRLETLRRNRAVLMDVKAALSAQNGTTTPASRPSANSPAGVHTGAGGPSTGRDGGGKPKPTLVDLVCGQLSGQPEPRSAGDVSADIVKAHPDRQVKITVVRATLESLVAQGRVRRSKRGRSVFYASATQPEEVPSAG